MLPQLGIQRDGLPRELVFVRELEAFDGPILSEYHAAGGAGVYVEKWCAIEEGVSRSLLVRTEQRAVAEYMGGRIPMLRLLTDFSDGVGFLVDRSMGAIVRVAVVPLTEIPAYLPKATAFHDETLRPEWDTVPQSYLIDERWDAKLLASIERIYLNAAGFSYFAAPQQKQRSLPDALLGFDYDGGFPIMHVFNHIRAAVPRELRPRSVGVSAASPGVLTLEAPAVIANQLRQALLAVPKSKDAYQALHQWSRLRPRRVDEVPLAGRDDVARLCRLLSVDPDKILRVPSGHEQEREALLIAGKLIAAYYRMLKRVVNPEKGVEFTGVKLEEESDFPEFDPADEVYDYEEDGYDAEDDDNDEDFDDDGDEE